MPYGQITTYDRTNGIEQNIKNMTLYKYKTITIYILFMFKLEHYKIKLLLTLNLNAIMITNILD